MEVILKPDYEIKLEKKIELKNTKITAKKGKEMIVYTSEFGLDLEINEEAVKIISKQTDFIGNIFKAKKATIYILSKQEEVIVELSDQVSQKLS